MKTIVWQSPVPSTAFLRGVRVDLRPNRQVALVFEFEDDDGRRSSEAVFSEVAHYRTTCLPALTADMIRDAYDRVVDLGDSQELRATKAAMEANGRAPNVRHFRICFDDGPCFDFMATSFHSRIVDAADSRDPVN